MSNNRVRITEIMLELNQLRIEQNRATEARNEQVKELLQELECLLKAVAWVSTEIDGVGCGPQSNEASA
jgi:hypothetical protein